MLCHQESKKMGHLFHLGWDPTAIHFHLVNSTRLDPKMSQQSQVMHLMALLFLQELTTLLMIKVNQCHPELVQMESPCLPERDLMDVLFPREHTIQLVQMDVHSLTESHLTVNLYPKKLRYLLDLTARNFPLEPIRLVNPCLLEHLPPEKPFHKEDSTLWHLMENPHLQDSLLMGNL
jgi:hypothetical protein